MLAEWLAVPLERQFLRAETVSILFTHTPVLSTEQVLSKNPINEQVEKFRPRGKKGLVQGPLLRAAEPAVLPSSPAEPAASRTAPPPPARGTQEPRPFAH